MLWNEPLYLMYAPSPPWIATFTDIIQQPKDQTDDPNSIEVSQYFIL